MFQFKDGRLYPDVIPQTLSFQVPGQFWIDTSADGYSDNSVMLQMAEKGFSVEIALLSGDDLCLETGDGNELAESEPVTLCGLKGSCVYCLTSQPQCIMALDVGDCSFHSASEPDVQLDQLVCILSTGACSGREEARRELRAALHSSDVQELMNSVRVC